MSARECCDDLCFMRRATFIRSVPARYLLLVLSEPFTVIAANHSLMPAHVPVCFPCVGTSTLIRRRAFSRAKYVQPRHSTTTR